MLPGTLIIAKAERKHFVYSEWIWKQFIPARLRDHMASFVSSKRAFADYRGCIENVSLLKVAGINEHC